MKLIISIGNPGEKYKNNRHNAGYLVIDVLKKLRTKELKNLILAKTDTYMNDSGSFVSKLINHYSLDINHLYVVHDDLDLPLGTWKIQYAKGPKDHGGINDIEQKLGTKNFWRVRVGVDNRKPEVKVSGEEYVLQDFTKKEVVQVEQVIKKAVQELCKKLATS